MSYGAAPAPCGHVATLAGVDRLVEQYRRATVSGTADALAAATSAVIHINEREVEAAGR